MAFASANRPSRRQSLRALGPQQILQPHFHVIRGVLLVFEARLANGRHAVETNAALSAGQRLYTLTQVGISSWRNRGCMPSSAGNPETAHHSDRAATGR